MKALVVRTLTAIAAVALAVAIGSSVQPASARPMSFEAAPICVAPKVPVAPTVPTPVVREQLLAV